MVGPEDFQLQCMGRDLVVKNRLGIKAAIVIAHPGVVAAHDQVGTAAILAEYGM